MNKYLPSKKFLYTIGSIIVAIIIILGVKALAQWQTNRNQTAQNEKALAENNKNISYEQFMALDSDKDGLPDWEEALWKTDPKKADTDGDGTSDGDEVKANRDPLKANTAKAGQKPNDLIDPTLIADQKKQETEFLQLSQTDQLSRTLFSQYIAAKGSGNLSDTDKQTIINTATGVIMNATTSKYTLSDLIILTTVSSTVRHKYGNDLGQAFFTGTNQAKVENELVILDRAVKNSYQKVLAGLDPIIESYSKTISKMLLVSVPSDVVYTHLNLLNDLLAVKDGLQKIKSLFTDPITAVIGMREYQSGSANLVKDTADIKNYFLDRNISFDKNEYGYVLLNII
jgi:hypothetical protein